VFAAVVEVLEPETSLEGAVVTGNAASTGWVDTKWVAANAEAVATVIAHTCMEAELAVES
jgi:hypothetical protein